eukprot:1596096-Amphidinium_carterae.1
MACVWRLQHLSGNWRHVLLPEQFHVAIGWTVLKEWGVKAQEVVDEVTQHMSAPSLEWRSSVFNMDLMPAKAQL